MVAFEVTGNYTVVILDTSPMVGLISVNAMIGHLCVIRK